VSVSGVPALARSVPALARSELALASCTGAGEICTSNLAQGQAAARVPDKPRQAPMYVANRGRRGALNVHLQASLLSNQVARCLMGAGH